MNKEIHYFRIVLLLLLAAPILYAVQPKKVEKNDTAAEQTISFRYENEDLINVINFIAAQKEVNVVLPQGANAIKAKLTLKLDKRLTIDEAWDLLKTILDVGGLSIIPKEKMFVITKTTPNISRDPMPVFIGTAIDELPDTDQRIRYVYYLSNMKVPAPEEEASSELAQLFKGLMQPGYVFKVDATTNAIIIAGISQDIRAAMYIVKELDKAGFQEKVEILHLRHTQANIVANLFMRQVLRPEQVSRYRLNARQQTETYFSKNTKIIPEPRTNSLIILGRAQAVDRVRDFINEYIDREIDSGKSILHVKKLQYRDAYQIAEVLKKVLESGRSAVAEQARAEQGPATGPQRFFDEVKIFADSPPPDGAATGEQKGATEYRYKGGNNIIVAARNDDWKRIKKLIEELDDPQPQVLIEVLIADLTVGNEKQLGSQTRNPDKIPLPGQIEPQFAHLQQSQADSNDPVGSADPPTTIQNDLLRQAYNAASDPPQPTDNDYANSNATAIRTIAGLAPSGSTLISFNDNDGKTWSILQVLDTLSYTKILSHPHIISTNNQKATIKIGQSRLVQGGVQTAEATATVKRETITADLEVSITPRVSEGKIVNLNVEIKIQEFTASAGSGNNTRVNRTIVTNANVKDGDILALGGLIRATNQQSLNETPILSRIPILGWFFKKRTGIKDETNLTVFISPMIILPRLRDGISEFTKDYIGVARRYSKEGALFDTLKEPITRWFFKSGIDVDKEIDKFIAKDEFQVDNPKKETAKYTKLKKTKNLAVASSEGHIAQKQTTSPSFNKFRTSAGSTEKQSNQLEQKQKNKTQSAILRQASDFATLRQAQDDRRTGRQDERLGTNKNKADESLLLTSNTIKTKNELSQNAEQAEKISLAQNTKHAQGTKIDKQRADKTKSHKKVTLKPQGEPHKVHSDIMLLTHDKQKRSRALQALINQDDENPLLKTAPPVPVTYLQS